MKRILLTVVLLMAAVASVSTAFAKGDEPFVYVIKKGDTLWGLSDRFLKDPHYWPDLWARNDPAVTNPHFIFPGQTLKVYPDRIVVEQAPTALVSPVPAPVSEPGSPPASESAEAASLPVPAPPVEEITLQRTFTVKGGAAFIQEKEVKPAGWVIATHQDRVVVGDDDIVYTDVGRKQGAKVGDRFSLFRNIGPVSHPINNSITGYKILPLGTVQLSEVNEDNSRAIVTKSYVEISADSYLMPYRDRNREVALKAASKDLSGYIITSQTGFRTIAAGDIAFIDLGSSQGLEVGNMLYVVRDIEPSQRNLSTNIGKMPVEVLGALVVVETGKNTASVLIVKSIDTIYPGDRVELKKNR